MKSMYRLFSIVGGGSPYSGCRQYSQQPLAAVPHPTCLLVILLLTQGCEQPFEEEFVGRIRFIRSVPSAEGTLPRELVHGSVTVYMQPRFAPLGMNDQVVLTVDGDPFAETDHPSTLLKGTVADVLEELAVRGVHDAIARIDGCDWMLVRGSTAGTIEVLRGLRRVAMLRLPIHGSSFQGSGAIQASGH